jgi:hypothetical protein
MGQIIFILFNVVVLAIALATGAFFIVLFAALIAGVSLFLFLYMKLTGRLPGGMRIYRFEQRTHREETPTAKINVIDAEYKTIDE